MTKKNIWILTEERPKNEVLETIAKYDNPEIKGVSGVRNYQKQKSDFCNKDKGLIELENILQSKNYKYLLLSYNNEGIMPQNKISKLMKIRRFETCRI